MALAHPPIRRILARSGDEFKPRDRIPSSSYLCGRMGKTVVVSRERGDFTMRRRMYVLGLFLFPLLVVVTGCTRERPHATVTPWNPTITVTTTATRARPVTTRTPTPVAVPSTTATSPLTPPVPGEQPAPTPRPTPTPTQSAPSGAATPTPAGGQTWHYYTVVRGDTLYSIATRFNTTVEELQRLNGLTDSTIFPGQKLKVPGPPGSEETGPVEYIVQEGDTLYSIARRFGVDMEELARVNNIADPSTIYAGQRLIIPGGRATPARQLYYVQPGDTLTSIAQRFGVSLQALMEANNITDPDQIYAGQVLRIP